MPLPTPTGDEEQDDFIGRCMGSSTMQSEYPEQKQRAAVCYSQWRRRETNASTEILNRLRRLLQK